MGDTGFEFPSFPASKLPSFQVSKFPSFQGRGVGEEGRTIERLGTDHVISGPMRGLKKTAPAGANIQTRGRFSKNPCKIYKQEISGANYKKL